MIFLKLSYKYISAKNTTFSVSSLSVWERYWLAAGWNIKYPPITVSAVQCGDAGGNQGPSSCATMLPNAAYE